MTKAVPEAHDAEDALDICAAEIGIDRYDDQVADDKACGECGERLS